MKGGCDRCKKMEVMGLESSVMPKSRFDLEGEEERLVGLSTLLILRLLLN